jgi:hypothetical protein
VFGVFKRPLLVNLEHSVVVTIAALYLRNFLRISATSKLIQAPHQVLLTCRTQKIVGVIVPRKWRQAAAGDREVVNLALYPRTPPNDAKG